MLQRMYREWPFFETLLSNMDMVLAKSDIAIASRYAELVSDTELRDRVFSRLRTEWQSTMDALRMIMGQESPLDATRSWRARSATASLISTRSTTCRSSS